MGKYLRKPERQARRTPFFLLPLSFLTIELFAFFFLSLNREAFDASQMWPLAFGLLWSVILGSVLYLAPVGAARVLYGFSYLFMLVYAGFQTGYYILFSEMMWLSEFLYSAEGVAYADVLLHYPLGWWGGILALTGQAALLIWKFPVWRHRAFSRVLAVVLALAASLGAEYLPETVFQEDKGIQLPALITAAPSPPRPPTTICSIPTGCIRSAACTRPWARISMPIPFFH